MLKTAKEPVFMLWRNSRAVIVGVNQNTAAEVDRAYCEQNGIRVVRRLTGGGAVFHDTGNVNYTYIEQSRPELFNDYAGFTRDVNDYLNSLGVPAVFSGRICSSLGSWMSMFRKCWNITSTRRTSPEV